LHFRLEFKHRHFDINRSFRRTKHSIKHHRSVRYIALSLDSAFSGSAPQSTQHTLKGDNANETSISTIARCSLFCAGQPVSSFAGGQDPAQRLRRTRNEVRAYAFGIFSFALGAGMRIEDIAAHFIRDDPNYDHRLSAVIVLAWLGLAFAFWRKILKKLPNAAVPADKRLSPIHRL
jgi:hypothetical protein